MNTKLPFLQPELVNEINHIGIKKTISKDEVILREGQYVKVIPVVLSGLIKVYVKNEDKELLLYYIQPNESCVMSFTAMQKNETSLIYAIAEENSTLLLLPVDHVLIWLKKYPEINYLFYQQFNLRYHDLIDTINHLLFDKLDKRLLDYLEEKIKITNTNPIKISHRQIALELCSTREVITRVIKKLELDGKIKQLPNSIQIL